jgi:hypothetical protein
MNRMRPRNDEKRKKFFWVARCAVFQRASFAIMRDRRCIVCGFVCDRARCAVDVVTRFVIVTTMKSSRVPQTPQTVVDDPQSPSYIASQSSR